MKKILGLDIGITSVGWGVIDENNNIIKTGVRLFDEALAANNVDRRTFRGGRRLIRRRNQRILDMKELLVRNNIVDDDFTPTKNPYKLRLKGLSKKLDNDELATILLHLAKRRGSSLEVVEEDSTSNSELSTKAILSKNEALLKEVLCNFNNYLNENEQNIDPKFFEII